MWVIVHRANSRVQRREQQARTGSPVRPKSRWEGWGGVFVTQEAREGYLARSPQNCKAKMGEFSTGQTPESCCQPQVFQAARKLSRAMLPKHVEEERNLISVNAIGGSQSSGGSHRNRFKGLTGTFGASLSVLLLQSTLQRRTLPQQLVGASFRVTRPSRVKRELLTSGMRGIKGRSSL